jgi:hypothetical protein
MTLTYVYCLVRSPRRPATRGVPPGMPGSDGVRVIDAGARLWAVVSSVAAEAYGESALASGMQDLEWVGGRAMAHEAVVEHFLGAAAVLPMQLFTLFTSDARALAHVARDRRRIDTILTRLEGQVEWGVRLSFDEQAARAAVEQQHGRASGAEGDRAAVSGAAYLVRKRDLLDVTRGQLTAAQAEADRVYQALARAATDARRRAATEQAMPGSRLLLDAAFLVPARAATSFRTAVRRQARALDKAAVVASVTGPWPAYNFIDAPLRRRPASAAAARRVTPAPRPRRSAARPRR